uniref:Methyl-CpG binding domain protein 3 n=6 Tax=Galliformes TaxID=8976 RepID=A0A8V1AFX7_CHICK
MQTQENQYLPFRSLFLQGKSISQLLLLRACSTVGIKQLCVLEAAGDNHRRARCFLSVHPEGDKHEPTGTTPVMWNVSSMLMEGTACTARCLRCEPKEQLGDPTGWRSSTSGCPARCSEHTDAVSVDNCVHSFPAEITGNKRSRVRSPALGINTNPSPSGKKFRSKPQLARYLGSSMDLSTFDFRTGKMLMSKMNKNRQRMRYDCSNQAKGKPDLNTALPVRQTASIFKQPVTKITNHPSNKVKSDPQKAVDQPRQLFWEKKLSGLNAFDIAEELVKTMDLPKGLQGVGPGCTDETLLSAIASALHTSTMPITGQLSAAVEKNPGVWLNTSQPLCKAFMVTDEDIRKQEELVQQVRKRLEEALMADMLAHVEEIARDGEAPTEKEGGEEEGEDEEEEEEQDHDQEMENV